MIDVLSKLPEYDEPLILPLRLVCKGTFAGVMQGASDHFTYANLAGVLQWTSLHLSQYERPSLLYGQKVNNIISPYVARCASMLATVDFVVLLKRSYEITLWVMRMMRSFSLNHYNNRTHYLERVHDACVELDDPRLILAKYVYDVVTMNDIVEHGCIKVYVACWTEQSMSSDIRYIIDAYGSYRATDKHLVLLRKMMEHCATCAPITFRLCISNCGKVPRSLMRNIDTSDCPYIAWW